MGYAKNIIVLKGSMRIKKRNIFMENLASIPAGETRLLLATARYAGRIHRFRDEKKEARIYDYVDNNVPMLLNMFKKRLEGYLALGYEMNDENTRRCWYS